MPECIDHFASQRALVWPQIEAFFRDLPPPLQSLGWTFAQRLGRQTAPTGEFRDALAVPAAARVVYLPLWHIDAYLRRHLTIPDVDELRARLFAAAFFGFCAIRIHDDLVDEDRPDLPVDELLLADLFIIEAIRHLQALFPASSPLWDRHARHWQEYAQAVRIDKERDRTGLAPFDETALRHIGRKAALLKTFPAAAALRAGQERELGQLEAMMDAFNTAIQLDNDIQSLRDDLESGHYTPPLAHAALEVGFAPGSHPSQYELCGSLILNDVVVQTHDLARDYYQQAQAIAAELGIGHLVDFIDWHLEDLRQSADRWAATRPDLTILQGLADPHASPATRAPSIRGNEGTPPNAGLPHPADTGRPTRQTMALDFLQFDPECRESWEIQRTGVWNRDLLIGDAFSRSLVLETLAECGRTSPEQVESLLSQYRRQGWRYYRDFAELPPDIDDLAQAMHLLRWSGWDEGEKREYLQTSLRWLEANRAPDGGFPVWLTEGIGDRPASGWIPLGGTRCIACEANLLAALAELEDPRVTEWLTPATLSLLDRWERGGYGAVYYDQPAFARYLLARYFARLRELRSLPSQVRARLGDTLQYLVREVETTPSGTAVDPLTIAAGLLVLLAAEDPPRDHIGRELDLLKQRQSFDGGWESVPFFRCPGSAGQLIGWHGGRLLTTSLVVRAMSSYILTSRGDFSA